MKRGLILGVLILVIVIPFIVADNSTSITSQSEKINSAYNCLKNLIDSKGCDSLSTEEKIFSLMTVSKCKSELIDDSDSGKCWPKSHCSIKTTAQALIALDEIHSDTSKPKEWLLKHEILPSDIIWYLQIESPEQTQCTISYSGNDYSISINTDKKINSNAGTCLRLAEGDYWLKISPSCYNTEFKISCDKRFLTNLLFKRSDSSVIHVIEKTNFASAEGTTTESVNSSCFSTTTSCDYEGTLWAAIALAQIGEDITKYLPYLMVRVDENKRFLPEAFLYALTGYSDFRNNLLLKQKNNKYWDESGDKFYDTAIALYPFIYEEPQEKTNSIDWLLEVQDDDYCWRDNIKDTAFILYSVWRKTTPKEDDGKSSINQSGQVQTSPDCIESGYYCMPSIDCQGNILSDYECSGTYKCCDTQKIGKTCSAQGGEICNSGEECVGGVTISASDTDIGQICCYGGTCEETDQETQTTECADNGGTCRTSCLSDEKEIEYSCDYSDRCCIQKNESTKNYWWIWILVTLIILVILGIIFRNKLKPYWFRFITKFKKSPPKRPEMPRGRFPPRYSSPRYKPGFPPARPPRNLQSQRFPKNKIPQQKIPLQPKQPLKPLSKPIKKESKEVDEVLKKLKEMSE